MVHRFNTPATRILWGRFGARLKARTDPDGALVEQRHDRSHHVRYRRAMTESAREFPWIPAGVVTPQKLEWLAHTVAVRPGISTDEVVRRAGLSSGDATRLRPKSCHIDSAGRWWPTKEVRALSEWCLVQPDPECMEPVDADWSFVRGVVDDDVRISVFTESFAWPPLRPNQHVLYKPHPLTVEGSGPWG